MIEFLIQLGNVLEVESDLLLLKYAQEFYGADKAVVFKLVSAGLCNRNQLEPLSGEYVTLETMGIIAPKRVLLIGVPPLSNFTYDQMHLFARKAITIISNLGVPIRYITTTVHGAGYGLDGGESLQRLVRGFQEGLLKHNLSALQRITFLTLGDRAERMLNNTLKMMILESTPVIKSEHTPLSPFDNISSNPVDPKPLNEQSIHETRKVEQNESIIKKRVFVALPYSEEFQNVYDFGIYPAVRNCGYICERVDETHFTGDILGRIRNGIETADIVIADLTEGRPNVYLEVGYAWGKGIPVIFVARRGEKLHFDVSTHRCIFYGRFNQFAIDLEELIRGVTAHNHK